MLLIMRNLFIKAILVSFCFVSFNTQAFETTYLVCSANNETNVFGFVVTFSDRLRNITNKREYGHTIASAYLANSERNDFIERPDGSDKAIIGKITPFTLAELSSILGKSAMVSDP